MARYAWCGDYNEASTFLDLWTSYSGNNDGKYANPEYDALMKDAKTMADPNPNYTKAEELLATDMPIIPIYHYTKCGQCESDIKGLPHEQRAEHLVRQEPLPRRRISGGPKAGGPSDPGRRVRCHLLAVETPC